MATSKKPGLIGRDATSGRFETVEQARRDKGGAVVEQLANVKRAKKKAAKGGPQGR